MHASTKEPAFKALQDTFANSVTLSKTGEYVHRETRRVQHQGDLQHWCNHAFHHLTTPTPSS
jgi:hypothetical protein